MATFTIEVPFPSDHAPFKIVRTGETGNRRIVDSAISETHAELLKRRWEKREALWDEPQELK